MQDITLRTEAKEAASLLSVLLDTYSIHGLSNDACDNEVRRWRFSTMAHLLVSIINLRISLAELLIRVGQALSNGLRFILFALTLWCLLILPHNGRLLLLFENGVGQGLTNISRSLSLILDYLWNYCSTEG